MYLGTNGPRNKKNRRGEQRALKQIKINFFSHRPVEPSPGIFRTFITSVHAPAVTGTNDPPAMFYISAEAKKFLRVYHSFLSPVSSPRYAGNSDLHRPRNNSVTGIP